MVTVRSGANRRYHLSLPPGSYELSVLTETDDTPEPYAAIGGPPVRLFDKPVTHDFSINHAIE